MSTPNSSSDKSGSKKSVTLVIRLLNNRSGGAERLYCELANFLFEDGYEVTCLYYDENTGAPFYPLSFGINRINLYPKSKDAISVANIGVYKRAIYNFLSTSIMGPFINGTLWRNVHGGFYKHLLLYFREASPDLAISFLPPANTPALLAARETSIRVIATNHNVPEEDYESPQRWDPSPYDRRLRLAALKHASAVHVLFPKFAKWFPADIREKIVAIPNYVPSSISRAALVWPRDKVILAAGRLAPTKNYLCLLEAWALIAGRHPDWSVHLYGVGPQYPALQSKIAEYSLGESFRLLGHKPDIETEYARAAIFCHPALHEGFGLSVAEALSLQVPVVAFSDCAGISEYVKDGINGLMVAREGGAHALARALERLINDNTYRAKLARNGPSSVAVFTEYEYRKAWNALIERVTA